MERKYYHIPTLPAGTTVATVDWNVVPAAQIDTYRWLDGGYEPHAEARLAFLPGYGFAKRSREEKEKWSALTDGYFTNNPHIDRLCAAVQLVDSRLGLTADDEAMVTFLRGNDIPFFAVATKVDKLNATERRENLAAIAAHPLLTGVQVIPFSALRGEGRNELLSVIGGLTGLKFGK